MTYAFLGETNKMRFVIGCVQIYFLPNLHDLELQVYILVKYVSHLILHSIHSYFFFLSMSSERMMTLVAKLVTLCLIL